jgi:dipeptidyl aminopeptidase/acylaminoacyl peptidase
MSYDVPMRLGNMLCLVAMFAAGARGQDKPLDVASQRLLASEIVSVPSGDLTLRGLLFRPEGPGPFPAVLFNHGSGKDYSRKFEALGSVLAGRGWIFFAPYRRARASTGGDAAWSTATLKAPSLPLPPRKVE